jgi:hypothetical protein
MADSDQKDINEFIKLIKSPETIKCELGAIGVDGIPKRFKKDYVDSNVTHGNVELLCVVYNKKPTATFTFNNVCDTQLGKRKAKMAIVQEYARINGVFIIPYINSKSEYFYGYETLYLAFKTENAIRTLLLATLWMGPDITQNDPKTSEAITKFKEAHHPDSLQNSHIINGILLGYTKDDLYGWNLKSYLNSNRGFVHKSNEEWMEAMYRETKAMDKGEMDQFETSFENMYKKSHEHIEMLLNSSDFISIKKDLVKYVQEIPTISFEPLGFNLNMLYL